MKLFLHLIAIFYFSITVIFSETKFGYELTDEDDNITCHLTKTFDNTTSDFPARKCVNLYVKGKA